VNIVKRGAVVSGFVEIASGIYGAPSPPTLTAFCFSPLASFHRGLETCWFELPLLMWAHVYCNRIILLLKQTPPQSLEV
jgi:hypothetical protein